MTETFLVSATPDGCSVEVVNMLFDGEELAGVNFSVVFEKGKWRSGTANDDPMESDFSVIGDGPLDTLSPEAAGWAREAQKAVKKDPTLADGNGAA